MPSDFANAEFDSLFTEVAAELGEEITLHGDEDEIVTALVDEPEEFGGEEDQAEIRTIFRIAVADKPKLTGVAEATILGQRWHILEPHPAQAGLVAVPVRRHQDENTRSQHFDLNDEQATLK